MVVQRRNYPRNKLLFLISIIVALKLIKAQVNVTPSGLENISFTQNLNEEGRITEENPNSFDGKTINTNQQQNISSWWLEVMEEVEKMLLYVDGCPKEKYECFYTNNQSSIYQRECECDNSCNVYGECCIDKAAITISPKKDPKYQQMICGELNKFSFPSNILMVDECLESMKGTTEELFCHQKVPFDSYEVTLDIPVISSATNYVYRNYYCALCNNDTEFLLEMNLLLTCDNADGSNLPIETFLQNVTYRPGERTYVREATSSKEADENKTDEVQTCHVEVSQDENLDAAERFNFFKIECEQQVSRCNSSWPDSSDFEKCGSYSLRIINSAEDIVYKNPHCAKCNSVNMVSKKFYCTDFNSVFLRRPFFVAEKGEFAFSVLFELQSRPPSRCEKSQDIWNPFTNKCTEIVCGSGRIFKGGKCVEKELGSLQSHNDTTKYNSTLKNNCPTVALDNFTLYENDSAYSFQTEKHYVNEEYELYNDSIILVCIDDSYYYKEFSALHYYTTIIVLSISLVCLAFHIILYICFKRMRTWHGKNLLCLCSSLFVAQLLFLTGITATNNFGFCVIMAVCLHYFWLASFCWMNVLSFDVWRTFRSQRSHASSNKQKLYLYYSLYSWGIPFLIVSVGLVLDLTETSFSFRPQYAGHIVATLCWINSRMGLLTFFLIPVGIIIIENLIFYIITSYRIHILSKESHFAQCKSQSVRQPQNDEQAEEHNQRTQKQENQTNKIRFSLYLRLGILQGMTWLSGFVATFFDSSVFWYIFTVMNGLQGAVIVFCFDFKKWVFLSMWENISKGLLSKFHKIPISTSSNDSALNKRRDQIQDNQDAEGRTPQQQEKENDNRALKNNYSLHSLKLFPKRNKDMVDKRFSSLPFGCRSYENPSATDESETGTNSSATTNTDSTQMSESSDFAPQNDFSHADVVVENHELREKL